MSELMGDFVRTDYCGVFGMKDVGREVSVCGFVQKVRDKGKLLFVDLRDRTGILQLTFDDSSDENVMKKAAGCHAEYVVGAIGVIRERSSKNKEIPTGDVEVFVKEFKIFAEAETPPFEVTDNTNVKEELRLKYRYLDLRRGYLQKTIMLRHKIAKIARDYFDENGFIEIETPMLIKSTPEGARDYLVPSRVHNGMFYALPQSPQLYKQLLMLSGFDRYMQITKCFRDEDLRADRQPEFTQIDLEMSFVSEDDVIAINEGFLRELFDKMLGIKLELPLKRIAYSEAMARYGSDKPDLRFGLELADLSDLLSNCEFKVFKGALESGSVRGINAKGLADRLTRKQIDKLTEFVRTYGAKGLAYTRIPKDTEAGDQNKKNADSSFEKFLSESEVGSIRLRMDAQPGDVIFIVADKNEVVFDALGALRCHIAEKFELYDSTKFSILWVTDFPQFEYAEDENRYIAKHHPFTAPKDEFIQKLESDPLAVRAKAYDIVINGYEVGGGSIRINDRALQNRMFKLLGFSEIEAEQRFGFLLDAFRYGAPPHGGLAYGLDRLTMVLLGISNIKDVIAFPKVQNASELMTNCPGAVDERQLGELGIVCKD